MLNKRSLKDFDIGLLIIIFLILVFGVLAVYSATYPRLHSLFWKQLMWIGISVVLGVVFFMIPHKFWNGFAWVFYFISIVSLVLVLAVGTKIHGVRRWFVVGGLTFQPSEFAKLGTIFLMASFLSNKRFQIRNLRNLITPLIIIGIPFILVLLEPDLGTSLVFVFTGILMLFYKGIKPLYFFIMVSPVIALFCGAHWAFLVVFLACLGFAFYLLRVPLNDFIPTFLINLGAGLLYPIFWQHLKPYQQARIIGFISPSHDIQGTGWQLAQSKIAIGSGGLFGKGILGGTQKGFAFLPQVHTDFIFAAIGEELGFLGCLLLLVCFFLLLWKGIKIAKATRSEFASFLAIGIVGTLGFQILVNIGMTMGIIPVVGVPLPFISYGGSSMLISMIMVGLLLNIAKHRFEY